MIECGAHDPEGATVLVQLRLVAALAPLEPRHWWRSFAPPCAPVLAKLERAGLIETRVARHLLDAGCEYLWARLSPPQPGRASGEVAAAGVAERDTPPASRDLAS